MPLRNFPRKALRMATLGSLWLLRMPVTVKAEASLELRYCTNLGLCAEASVPEHGDEAIDRDVVPIVLAL
jgi:hypothetical protein